MASSCRQGLVVDYFFGGMEILAPEQQKRLLAVLRNGTGYAVGPTRSGLGECAES